MTKLWGPEKHEQEEKSIEAVKDSQTPQELYEHTKQVLTFMESNFKDTLREKGKEVQQFWPSYDQSFTDNYDNVWNSLVEGSNFDNVLDLDNPQNIFEKKWKELLQQCETLCNDVGVTVAGEKLVSMLNNIKTEATINFITQYEQTKEYIEIWVSMWYNLFGLSLNHNSPDIPWDIKNAFSMINTNEDKILATFNIPWGSTSFAVAYREMMNTFENQNLFDYINKIENWAQKEALTFSTLTWLCKRGKVEDFYNLLDKSTPETQTYIKNYIDNHILKDYDFTIAFLSSVTKMEDLINRKTPIKKIDLPTQIKNWNINQDNLKSEDSDNLNLEESPTLQYLLTLIQNIKKDSDIQKAYEQGTLQHIDQADIFTHRKVHWLMLYDNDQWGWKEVFKQDLEKYQKELWYSVSGKQFDPQGLYTKYILTDKNNNTIVMIQLNTEKTDSNANSLIAKLWPNEFKDIMTIDNSEQDYNLFTLRGHCNRTKKFAENLGDMVWENDILVDGGCYGDINTKSYYGEGVKWLLFAYENTWIWASTRELTKDILNSVSDEKWSLSNLITLYQTWKYDNNIKEETYISQSNPEFNPKNYAMKNLVMPNDIAHIYARYCNNKKTEQNSES